MKPPLHTTRAPGSYAGLTVKQAELLSFIRHEALAGRTPSFDEMSAEIGVVKSGISRLIAALTERGYVQRLENRARAIVVTEEQTPLPPKCLADATIMQLLGEIGRRGLRVELAEGAR